MNIQGALLSFPFKKSTLVGCWQPTLHITILHDRVLMAHSRNLLQLKILTLFHK